MFATAAQTATKVSLTWRGSDTQLPFQWNSLVAVRARSLSGFANQQVPQVMLFAASAFMSSLTDIIAGADPGVGALLLANIVNITL
jgi:hypothetical protein